MIEELVTVVVPVYNSEAFLDRCVSSIVGQTYADLEIILVDDGSSDESPKMCEFWKNKDARIKVIHQKNAGAGMARNTGIDAANGEYICFCDSDDFLHPDMVKICRKVISSQQADIVHYGMFFADAEGNIKGILKPDKISVFCGSELKGKFIPDIIGANPKTGYNANYSMRISNCMFSMSLINETGWRCASERDVYSEDVMSLLEFFGSIKCAATVDRALYYYCNNGVSITHTLRKNEFEQIKKFYEKCLTLCDDMDFGENIRCRLNEPFLNFTIAALKKITCCDKPFSEKKRLLSDVLKDRLLQNVLLKTKSDKNNVKKKLLFFLWRKQCVILSYILLRLKSK